MKWGRQYIHCGNCGARLLMSDHWQNSMANAPTCGKECNDAMNMKYAAHILGHDAPEPPTEKMRESEFDKLVQAELSKDPRT